MVNGSKLTIGLLLFIIAYYVGVVGIDYGSHSQYEWADGPDGTGVYKVTYAYTYPWLGALLGIYGLAAVVLGIMENKKKLTPDETGE